MALRALRVAVYPARLWTEQITATAAAVALLARAA